MQLEVMIMIKNTLQIVAAPALVSSPSVVADPNLLDPRASSGAELKP